MEIELDGIIRAISTIGFPIVAYFLIYKMYKEHIANFSETAKIHAQEIVRLTSKIEENIVMIRLLLNQLLSINIEEFIDDKKIS